MASHTVAGLMFPATCRRCGGRVSGPVSFCPHCGANAMQAFGAGASASASSKAAGAQVPLGDALRPPRPTPLFAMPGARPRTASRAPPLDTGRQWGLTGSAGFALVAVVVLFGGYVLLRQSETPDSPARDSALRTVVGTVTPDYDHRASVVLPAAPPPAKGGAHVDGALAMNSPAAQPAPALKAAPPPLPPAVQQPAAAPATAAPMVALPAPAPAAPAPATPAKPKATSRATAVARSQASRPDANTARPLASTRAPALATTAPTTQHPLAPTVVARTQPPPPNVRATSRALGAPDASARAGQQAKAVPHELAAAWESLQKSDLRGAKGALANVLAEQPENSEAFMLRQDLASRERARDAALITARGCAALHDWNCVWHYAGNALSIDKTNVEAKALVQRSIVDSGAAYRSPGPGPTPDDFDSEQ